MNLCLEQCPSKQEFDCCDFVDETQVPKSWYVYY